MSRDPLQAPIWLLQAHPVPRKFGCWTLGKGPWDPWQGIWGSWGTGCRCLSKIPSPGVSRHRCVLGEERDQENKGLGEGSQTSSAATLPLLTLVSSLFHALARLGAPGPWHDCRLHRECPSPYTQSLFPPLSRPCWLKGSCPPSPRPLPLPAWFFSNTRCHFLM